MGEVIQLWLQKKLKMNFLRSLLPKPRFIYFQSKLKRKNFADTLFKVQLSKYFSSKGRLDVAEIVHDQRIKGVAATALTVAVL